MKAKNAFRSVMAGIFFSVACAGAIGDVAPVSPEYVLTVLPTFGGSFGEAYAINRLGQVVGDATTDKNVLRAFLYSSGSLSNLGALSSGPSHAFGINDLGQIVGDSSTGNADLPYHAVRFAGGGVTDLGTIGGLNSQLFAINDSGLAAGVSDLSCQCGTHVVTHTSGDTTLTDFRPNDLDVYSGGGGINKAGTISGFVHISSGSAPAALFEGTKKIVLGTLGGPMAYARDVNDLGQATGRSSMTNDQDQHAFLWNGTGMSDLGTLGGNGSSGLGINDEGEVVGVSVDGTGQSRAFLYHAGVMRNLNDLVINLGGFVLTEARDINDSGAIVGIGIDEAGGQRAFLLTPVPEPATCILLLGGLGLLRAGRWIRGNAHCSNCCG